MTGALTHASPSGFPSFSSNLSQSGLTHSIVFSGGATRTASFNALGIDLDDANGNSDIRPGSISLFEAGGVPATPDLDSEVTTKKYVDDRDATKLNLSGGTLTGALTLDADPTVPLHAATKQYVDGLGITGYAPLAGADFTGDVSVDGEFSVTNRATVGANATTGLVTLDGGQVLMLYNGVASEPEFEY
jgi:hypothetical protein